jgi:hypothetical protein
MHIDLTTALKIAVILGIILWFPLAWKFGGRARDPNGGFGGGGDGGDVGGHGGTAGIAEAETLAVATVGGH